MIHPAPHYIKTTRSEVQTHEDQTKSGLHVVRNIDPSDQRILRGIVEAIGAHVEDEWADIKPGVVLFYTTATRLGEHDFVLCHYDRIIGWEDSL